MLTATPSVDLTVHADAVALANRRQPDPDSTSRYGELTALLMEYEKRAAIVTEEVMSDDEAFQVELDPGHEDTDLIALQFLGKPMFEWSPF